jgi:hypothetical protein
MGRFTLVGEPGFSGAQLYWSAVLDPGTFEQVEASGANDIVDVFRMEANDPSGIDAHSTSFAQYPVPLAQSVMPGDTYTGSLWLDLPHGYYHIMLTIDEGQSDGYYRLNVRVDDSGYELKSWSYA